MAKKLITIGIVLIFSQIMSMVGLAQAGNSLSANLHGGINDVIFLAGYFCVGIVGVILLTVGLVKRRR